MTALSFINQYNNKQFKIELSPAKAVLIHQKVITVWVISRVSLGD